MHDHHSHQNSHAPSSTRALFLALGVTAVIFIAQVIGGLVSGSLALVSDAMHMLSDSTGLLLALIAVFVGRRRADHKATFGYRRVEVIAATVNGVVVTGIAVWIAVRALTRLGGDAPHIDTGIMLVVATVGLVANAVSALILTRHQHDSLNLRGAYLHVLSDLLGSVAVIVAGLIIRFTGWVAADTIASLIIAGLVLPRALALVRDSLRVLLNNSPAGIDAREVEDALNGLEHVNSVHDLHLWSIDGSTPLATCHLVSACPASHNGMLLDAAQARLRDFGIEHSTIQIEESTHQAHEDFCRD